VAYVSIIRGHVVLCLLVSREKCRLVDHTTCLLLKRKIRIGHALVRLEKLALREGGRIGQLNQSTRSVRVLVGLLLDDVDEVVLGEDPA